MAMVEEIASIGFIKEAIKPAHLHRYTNKRMRRIITSALFFKEKF